MSQTITPLSIYLHIPFCGVKCSYCAFNTYIHLEKLIPAFIAALQREIEIVGAQTSRPVATVFFGGGTPSLLTRQQIEQLLRAIAVNFNVQRDAEISLESNPNDLNVDYLRSLREIGINRLSIGMQSAIESELQLFDRRHDNDAVVRSVSAARRAGFDNLNLDLIYGAPHQTLSSWDATLQQMLALQPEHVSLYALGVEDGTAMQTWIARGYLPAPDDDLAADMYDLATERLGAAGFEQYEISNWARPGYQCRHNLQYWRNLPYVGLGPGAHGFAAGTRYATILSPQQYIRMLQADEADVRPYPQTPATDWATIVSPTDEIAETLMMGLRLTQEGIHRPTFAERFGADLFALHGENLQRFVDYGLLTVEPDRVRLTQEGRLLSNMIFRELV